MSVKSEHQGSCLCGAVHIFVKTNSKSVAACHCNMYRKWMGGPLLAIECGNQIRFEGSENISVFNSSEWAKRGFCSKRGSHLFYRLKQEGDYIIPVGLLDNDSNFTFEQQIFIDQKPSFYSFANKTKNMTGVEVFAQYSEFSDQG
ncbi:MAG: GFA family protein [Okeania sp. SIO2G4]|uniref:GFA family protein n=1 Tax=unclassified Okeania TaxID=2634635 RepID=UPI0013B85CBE|nr:MULTISPECIES: GFA family protein [unclassified Okeania]NEP05969.1 GFA family protein [Okeania sp. SIO4D6]NEP75723.1 GFA family protein [Okeania sp. SIO2G5]NEP96859.1 GFA family protein [Okeania sp. SIO2F5]NEQ94532.1 GFA family protein [Okeania sp. SIO2G4]